MEKSPLESIVWLMFFLDSTIKPMGYNYTITSGWVDKRYSISCKIGNQINETLVLPKENHFIKVSDFAQKISNRLKNK